MQARRSTARSPGSISAQANYMGLFDCEEDLVDPTTVLQSVLDSDLLAFKSSAKTYKNDLTGQPLDPALDRAARQKELDYFNRKGVWHKCDKSEALAKTGKKPVIVRWVDVNKGDDEQPNYRSRFVAREIRRKGDDPMFAPIPPLESLRTVLSVAATTIPGYLEHDYSTTGASRTQVSFIDIARAYFCAKTDPDNPTYVELPEEDGDHERLCGRLLRHM